MYRSAESARLTQIDRSQVRIRSRILPSGQLHNYRPPSSRTASSQTELLFDIRNKIPHRDNLRPLAQELRLDTRNRVPHRDDLPSPALRKPELLLARRCRHDSSR